METIEQRPLLSDEVLDKYAKFPVDVCGSWDSISFPVVRQILVTLMILTYLQNGVER